VNSINVANEGQIFVYSVTAATSPIYSTYETNAENNEPENEPNLHKRLSAVTSESSHKQLVCTV